MGGINNAFSGGTITGDVTISGNLTVTGTTAAQSTTSVVGVADFAAGTVSLPSITFTGDTNTGLYQVSADTIGFTSGGVQALRIHTSLGSILTVEDATTTTVLTALTLVRSISGGVGGAETGVGISFQAENNAGTLIEYSRLDVQANPTTAGNDSGGFRFYTRQSGTTSMSMTMAGAGNPTVYFRSSLTVASPVTIGASTFTIASGSTTVGSLTNVLVFNLFTVASAAGATLKGISIPARTYTTTGTTQITTATGFNPIEIGVQTITDSSAVTIDLVATEFNANWPISAGSATITVGAAYAAGSANNLINAAGTIRTMYYVPAHTQTLTATTQMTAVSSISAVRLGIITIAQSGGAVTVDGVSTLYIAGAPAAGASVTLTKAYSLWIDAGLPRIDSVSANNTVACVLTPNSGPTGANAAVQEWLTVDINGTTRYIPCW